MQCSCPTFIPGVFLADHTATLTSRHPSVCL